MWTDEDADLHWWAALDTEPEPHDDSARLACQHEGCTQAGNPCWLPDWAEDQGPDRVPDDWYCPEHAHSAGYCWGCGQFWAGVESFEFLNRSGLCDNCQDQADAEEGDWDFEDHPMDCECEACTEVAIETAIKIDMGLLP